MSTQFFTLVLSQRTATVLSHICIFLLLAGATGLVYAQSSKTGESQTKEAMLGFLRINAIIDLDGDGVLDLEDYSPIPSLDSLLVNVHSDLFDETFSLGNDILSRELSNLVAGEYTISVLSIPSGWVITTPSVELRTVSLTSSDTVTFMFFKLISISGNKFHDINGNGYKDFNEPGLSNWKFFITPNDSALSDSAGTFQFFNVGPGTYTLYEIQQSGWTRTYPPNPAYTFMAFSGLDISYQDFGNFNLGKFIVDVTVDFDGDGVADAPDILPLPAGTQVTTHISKDTSTNLFVQTGNGIRTTEVSNLGMGTYDVSITSIPSGWMVTTANVVSKTINVSEQVDTVRFMLFKLISVSGIKYEDKNGNGVKEGTEHGLSGWTFTLNSFNSVSDSLGGFYFDNIGPGSHTLSENPQSGWINTAPASPNFNFTAFSGTDISNLEFGNFKLGTLRIEARIDLNGDGIFDSTDVNPLPSGTSIVVNITRDSTLNFNLALGNDTLSREVTNLGVGEYTITLSTVPTGWIRTTLSSYTSTISLSGEVDTIKFMFFKRVSVSGKKFNDIDGNGIKNVNEPGLEGWTIFLNDTTFTTTDSVGFFNFSDVGPGTYLVREEQQDGWYQTTPVSTGFPFIALSGNNITNMNFGNFKLGSIFGQKFNDSNNNGVKDSQEIGMSDWQILLVGASTFTTLTDSTGNYEFKNLYPGAYKVFEVHQQGWVQTYPSSGRYTDTISISGQVLVDRDFGNYQPPNSLSGMKFFDINANGVKDSTEPGLEHWLIKLYDSSRDLAMVDTTDSSGFYSFQDLAAGTYTIREVQQDGWIQTHPRTADLSTGVPPGVHIVTVANGINRTELNFGNTVACRYIGPPSGSWRDPANWSCGHAPDAGTPIIIPQDTIVVVDSLSSDSIHSVRVQRGGRILFGTLTTHLRIHGSVQIDSGASIIFPSGDSLGLIVYGDWINDGSFDPGTSTIYFSGDSAKTIVAGVLFDETESGGLTTKRRRNVNDYSANNFYNLVIDGENTSLIGNMRIQNTLTLDQSLAARPEDTVFIENSSPSSIESAGLFPQGSLKRAIDQTNGGTYRFESPSSTLSFSAGDQLPDSVMVTTLPDTTTNVFSLQWRVVGGTLDTTANTIRVDSIGKFSKWVFGKPGAGYHKGASSSMQYGTPTINRLYTISTTGGGDFNATLQLRYDDDELQPSETQEELVLLQGPVVAQTLKQNWNMVSIPVVPETTYDVSALFPGAISNAFSFVPNAGYNIENSMELDAGYWLKYGSDQTIGILGDERTTATINLETDWNLIGSITFPVPTTSIVDNGAGITGSFFGYNNGYYLADTLTPMQGYWVKATASGSIMLESNGVPAAKSYSVNNVLQTLHRLLITDVAGSQQELYFGSNSELNEAMFEMPPTPPSGIFDARFANGSMVALASENEVKEMPVNLSSVTYPLQISWESPTEKNVQAEFLAGGRTILLAGKGSARIETATNLRLRIYPSSSNATLPLEYKLEQNYPNPFNPVTNFKFSVKNEGFVTLNIYDVLGREIAMVVNEKLQPGTYNTSWNAGGVASGVYFYRLTIFDAASTTTSPVYQEQKKLILVK